MHHSSLGGEITAYPDTHTRRVICQLMVEVMQAQFMPFTFSAFVSCYENCLQPRLRLTLRCSKLRNACRIKTSTSGPSHAGGLPPAPDLQISRQKIRGAIDKCQKGNLPSRTEAETQLSMTVHADISSVSKIIKKKTLTRDISHVMPPLP